LLAVFGLAGALWAADPFVGTWKVDVAKSKTSYPLEFHWREASQTKAEGQDNGIKVVEDLAWATGMPFNAGGLQNMMARTIL